MITRAEFKIGDLYSYKSKHHEALGDEILVFLCLDFLYVDASESYTRRTEEFVRLLNVGTLQTPKVPVDYMLDKLTILETDEKLKNLVDTSETT